MANFGKYGKEEILKSMENFGKCICVCAIYLYVYLYLNSNICFSSNI